MVVVVVVTVGYLLPIAVLSRCRSYRYYQILGFMYGPLFIYDLHYTLGKLPRVQSRSG